MTSEPSILTFRCEHRHSAISHPKCYLKYISGGKQIRHSRSARILVADIETLPGEYYAFDPKVEYLHPSMQIKDWSISCWSAKWLFESEVMGESVSRKEAHNREDISILTGIWKLLNEANIVVFHNGIRFDVKKLNTRFVEHGMIPPAKYLVVDTYKVAKDVFGFSYNRLDELGQKFGIGKKLDMSMLDWKNCLTNDKSADDALVHMLDYCKQDISPLLEDVYLCLLPYMDKHPNLNVWSTNDTDACRNCESTDLYWGEKPYATPQGLWESWRCNACGATGRGTGKTHKIKGSSVA